MLKQNLDSEINRFEKNMQEAIQSRPLFRRQISIEDVRFYKVAFTPEVSRLTLIRREDYPEIRGNTSQ